MPITRGTKQATLFGGGERIRYLLQATFNAADQGFADAQVLDIAAEGVQAGQLTVVEVDGTLAISSNKMAFTAQSTPVWGDLGIYSQAITKVLGRGLLGIINLSTWEEIGSGWHSAAAVVDPDSTKFAIQANTTDGQLDEENGVVIVTGLSLNTDYSFALVLGGYDVNGVVWRSGEIAANYLYGAAYYLEIAGSWTLIWKNSTDSIATLYAILSCLDAVGNLDDFRVSDKDLSDIFQPTALSTFDAPNSTSLDAITPEVGGGWTEHIGDFDIQSNKAEADGTVQSQATVDSLLANCIIDCAIVIDDTTVAHGILIRYIDNNNFWFFLYDNFPEVRLIQRELGGNTVRATTVIAALGDGTIHDFRAITDGNNIDCFLDGGDKTAYASATFNNTATRYGIYPTSLTGVSFNNFTVFPRTTAIYDTTLDAV